MASETVENEKKNKPKPDQFRQQKLPSWQPIMTPLKVVIAFLAIGVAFVPTGVSLMKESDTIYESSIVYDSKGKTDVDCKITQANEGKVCTATFNFNQKVKGPLYVYYELTNFYQNHRTYVSSIDYAQLNGVRSQGTCTDKNKNGSVYLNPCGLIANSFFNDQIALTTNGYTMKETDIAWSTDTLKYIQPDGFKAVSVGTSASTKSCADVGLETTCTKNFYDSYTGNYYYYYYSDESEYQYLYETYSQINPVYGVQDPHFMVWMRTASLPNFRKLYGVIDSSFSSGDSLTFVIDANFEVTSFGGTKTLTISTLSDLGGKNTYLGIAYIIVGGLSLFLGVLFATKSLISPRPIGDPKFLNWH
jgi:hypothetical protein